MFLVTQRVEFYDIEAKGKIASVEEEVGEEKMGNNNGKVEKLASEELEEVGSSLGLLLVEIPAGD